MRNVFTIVAMAGFMLVGFSVAATDTLEAQTGYLYVFDDCQPNWITDASGHGFDMRPGSTPGPDAADPVLENDPGDPGLTGDRRLRFDGVDDYAYGPLTDTRITDFTLECRFTRDQNASLFGSQVLVSTKGGQRGGYELRIDIVLGTPNLAFVWFDADGKEYAVRGGSPVDYNRPYHAAAVYFHKASVTTVVLYLNGEPVGVTSVIGGQLSYDGSQGVYLGNSHASTMPLGPADEFKGTIDDVRLEHTDMNADQVQDRYCRPLNALLVFGGANRPGGTLFLGPYSPGEVNRTYALLVSLTAPSGALMPGTDTREIPVGLDMVTAMLLQGSPLGQGIYGTLLDAGWGFGSVTVPAIPTLVGTRVYGAFAVLEAGAPGGVRRLSLGNQIVLGP